MTNKNLVAKYYEMWNSHNFDAAEMIFDKGVHFRGSIGTDTVGIEQFKDYANTILTAFPNLYHATEIVVAEDSQVAVYVSYIGTHSGKLLDYEPTGNKINYSGASFFSIKNGKITDIKVLGDRYSLYNQISS
ncbi:MAG: ester cyclase [Sulfurimonas sp.]|uniref:ester cyclase n=1 Tax=Sulfurimonas sp. TaxID=2022749 RepID=UPI002630144C|nr:ester cyclase [Sulfurimonas sp.]MCW8896068.1 ester cyclase [Sulfurimonas sp.]MCW8954995.1 ester cyclase [Sulfurimonas sp.]MCW9067625.1 ester cyclase [Sulfurimonas sp.]